MSTCGELQRLVSWLGIMLLAVSAACAPAPERSGPAQMQQAGPKRITTAIAGEPFTLSSTINTAGVGGFPGVAELESLIHVGLAEVVDQRTVVAPRLAETLPSVENGLWVVFPDGRMETTWRINPRARWHDGTPFTSADLVFTAQVEQDKGVPVLNNRAYDSVESIEAIDPQAIRVRWKQPFIHADLMFSVYGVPLPRHLLEAAYLEDKGSFAEQSYFTRDFIGTGPFRVKEFAKSSYVILEAFDDYVLGRPRVDQIEVKFFLDPKIIIAHILAGTVDANLGRGMSPEQALVVREQAWNGKADMAYSSWIALFPQLLNPSPPIIADARFRRALLYGTDRQQLVDALLGGLSTVADSFVGPNDAEYQAVQGSAVRYPYDPRLAGQLVESLGLTRGPDGSYLDSAGQRITLEIRTTADDDLREKTLLTVADHWRRLGLATETVPIAVQRSQDLEYRVNRPGFELVRQPNTLTDNALRRFHSSAAALPENGYRGSNRVRYMSPEYDALVERYLSTIPIPERLEIGREIVRHISEQLPAMGLYYSVQPMLISNRLVNVAAATDTRNAHQWDVR